jgi:hydrogenase large subunit
MTHLVLDPVTRVTGHLRVEVEVADGIVGDAWVSGTMYRGLERILVGRDPRDAWLMAQRICGVCGTSHALASVRAVEAALGARVPTNARLIRNLLAGTQLVVDHVAGFYQRQAFDWVDLEAALRADPGATADLAQSLGHAATGGPTYFRAVRDRLERMLGSSQPGPFGRGDWGHPAYRLGPELSLLIATHYLESLDWCRKVMRVHTLLGGKSPHPQTYLVGGMVVAPPWGGPSRPVPGQHLWSLERETPPVLGSNGLNDIAALLDDAGTFVRETYLADVLALAAGYRDSTELGSGIGHYLAFGAFPEDGSDRPALLVPRGRVMDRDVGSLVQAGERGVAEAIAHSWYADDGTALRHPSEGGTEARYTGPKPPFDTLRGADRYSWVKAARYEDDPMEVGPAARMLVGLAAGAPDISTALGEAMEGIGGPGAMFGALGRLVAGAVEAKVVAGRLPSWLDALRANLASGDLAVADVTTWAPDAWPRHADGFSLGESARGAVGHWVSINDGRIERYQVVDAGNWNASPRDQRGRRGALEEALVGTPIADTDRPLELLRTIHSFDPCLACGVH